MNVRQLMRLKPKTVTVEAHLEEVWQLVSKLKFHILPVVDEHNHLRGIITAEDILKNLVPDYRALFSDYYPQAPTIEDIVDQIEKQINLCARDVMNKTVYSITPEADVYKALSKMMARNVRILPVVNQKEILIGFIVEKDIFRYLFLKEQKILKKIKKLKKSAARQE